MDWRLHLILVHGRQFKWRHHAFRPRNQAFRPSLACMSLWRRQFEWRPLFRIVHGRQMRWRHHANTNFYALIHLPINTSTPSTILPHQHSHYFIYISHYFIYITYFTISSSTKSSIFIYTNSPTICLYSQWAKHTEEQLQTSRHT